MGSPTTFPNNCNMADGCHIELRKNANNPYQMKICAHNFVKDATLDRLPYNNCKTAFSLQCRRQRIATIQLLVHSCIPLPIFMLPKALRYLSPLQCTVWLSLCYYIHQTAASYYGTRSDMLCPTPSQSSVTEKFTCHSSCKLVG